MYPVCIISSHVDLILYVTHIFAKEMIHISGVQNAFSMREPTKASLPTYMQQFGPILLIGFVSRSRSIQLNQSKQFGMLSFSKTHDVHVNTQLCNTMQRQMKRCMTCCIGNVPVNIQITNLYDYGLASLHLIRYVPHIVIHLKSQMYLHIQLKIYMYLNSTRSILNCNNAHFTILYHL